MDDESRGSRVRPARLVASALVVVLVLSAVVLVVVLRARHDSQARARRAEIVSVDDWVISPLPSGFKEARSEGGLDSIFGGGANYACVTPVVTRDQVSGCKLIIGTVWRRYTRRSDRGSLNVLVAIGPRRYLRAERMLANDTRVVDHIPIGGSTATLALGADQVQVLTWQLGADVRFVLRGDGPVSRATLIEAARSLHSRSKTLRDPLPVVIDEIRADGVFDPIFLGSHGSEPCLGDLVQGHECKNVDLIERIAGLVDDPDSIIVVTNHDIERIRVVHGDGPVVTLTTRVIPGEPWRVATRFYGADSPFHSDVNRLSAFDQSGRALLDLSPLMFDRAFLARGNVRGHEWKLYGSHEDMIPCAGVAIGPFGTEDCDAVNIAVGDVKAVRLLVDARREGVVYGIVRGDVASLRINGQSVALVARPETLHVGFFVLSRSSVPAHATIAALAANGNVVGTTTLDRAHICDQTCGDPLARL